ncbi:uncharacterized protein LOC128982948 isoform X2 [Macrosteles quadrilineatus]|uniref:uncharacterized protein LOC128982948 isoform X2 n=1 Tax=Macrosteles quadrilineatus TaxID=74068 RepID=UPI0023E2188B|nr:uncharacterized protein LOC128982948 isoform X2 [Macrosteles quadrilineatus]
MKYGLPRDEKPKKRWKAKIENELRDLQMEVCFLKKKLEETNKKLIESSSTRPQVQSTFTAGKDCSYQSTWDYDKTIARAVRFHSITFMECYKDDISFEELRYKDYDLIGTQFLDQIASISSDMSDQNNCNPACTKPKVKKSSDIGTLTDHDTCSNHVLLELRKMSENMKSLHDRFSKFDCNLSDLSSRLSIMDSRLSTIDIHFTMQRFDKKWQGLETRLTELETSSPAKVLALLHDKSTKSPLTKAFTEEQNAREANKISNPSFHDNEVKENLQTSGFETSGVTLKVPIKNKAESFSSINISDMNLADFVKSISCADVTLGIKSGNASTIADANISSECSSKKNVGMPSIEMVDLKLFSSLPEESSLVQNSSQKDNGPSINSSKLKSTPVKVVNKVQQVTNMNSYKKMEANSMAISNTSSEFHEETERSKLGKLPRGSLGGISNSSIIGPLLNDPLGVTEQNLSISDMEDNNSSDNEFVIVEKSDVEESMQEVPKTNTLSPILNEAASSLGYNDITEYLEINLGKKKNLVYEFGFEAKADCLLTSENDATQGIKSDGTSQIKAQTPSKEDSFQNFKTNFMGSQSVDAKQSSPFDFCVSKIQNKLPERSTAIQS